MDTEQTFRLQAVIHFPDDIQSRHKDKRADFGTGELMESNNLKHHSSNSMNSSG